MYKTGKKTQTDNFLPSSELPQQPVSWCKVEVGIFLFSIWRILFFCHYFVFIKCNIIITILQAVVTKPDHVEVASEQSPPPPMVRL